MNKYESTRIALWTQRTKELCKAQELDLKIKDLQIIISRKKIEIAECQHRAYEFEKAALALAGEL